MKKQRYNKSVLVYDKKTGTFSEHKTKKSGKSDWDQSLWRVFSEFIRLRDSMAGGIIRCCTCGRFKFWRDCDAGHYIKRDRLLIKYDEHNVHGQCVRCNRFRKGEEALYSVFIVERYGKTEHDRLHALGAMKNAQGNDTVWMEQKRKYYAEKVKKLKYEKGL